MCVRFIDNGIRGIPRQVSAQGGCSIEVMKVAFPPVDLSFDFVVDSSVDPRVLRGEAQADAGCMIQDRR
jgi:hypothetical protein